MHHRVDSVGSWTHSALWHKAWLESRTRFLAGVAVVALYCVTFVQAARFTYPPSLAPTMAYSEFVWRGIYSGIDVTIFVLLALLFGLGGVQRERALGTALFTLSLPIDRSALVVVRAIVAVVEVAAIALIPVVVVPGLSPHYARHSYPVAQALEFAFLFTSVGAVWVAIGLVWSTVLVGEHSTVVACVMTPVLYVIAVNTPTVREVPVVNLFNVMNGFRLPYLDPHTSFLVAWPWTTLLVLAVVTAGGMVAAVHITNRQDLS